MKTIQEEFDKFVREVVDDPDTLPPEEYEKAKAVFFAGATIGVNLQINHPGAPLAELAAWSATIED